VSSETLQDPPRCCIIWRPGGRKEDPPRGRGEDCPNFHSFPQPVEIVENSNSQKVKNPTFLVF